MTSKYAADQPCVCGHPSQNHVDWSRECGSCKCKSFTLDLQNALLAASIAQKDVVFQPLHGDLSGRDPISHPPHHTQHPSGVECITITEHMTFNLGNVVKYVWRADAKGAPLDDLKKARWYLDREIARREGKS